MDAARRPLSYARMLIRAQRRHATRARVPSLPDARAQTAEKNPAFPVQYPPTLPDRQAILAPVAPEARRRTVPANEAEVFAAA